MRHDHKWSHRRIDVRDADNVPRLPHYAVLVFRTEMHAPPAETGGPVGQAVPVTVTDYYAFDYGWTGAAELTEMLRDLEAETDPMTSKHARIPQFVTLVVEKRL